MTIGGSITYRAASEWMLDVALPHQGRLRQLLAVPPGRHVVDRLVTAAQPVLDRAGVTDVTVGVWIGAELVGEVEVRDGVATRIGMEPGGPSPRGRTIREAIAIALEAVSGRPSEWLAAKPQLEALIEHVTRWVHDYARHRDVILTDDDITSELTAVLADLRGGAS